MHAVQEARFAGACQDQHAGRPAPSLGWPGERKSIGATSRGKRCFSNISWWAPGKRISRCNKPRLRGLGPGLPGAWQAGPQNQRHQFFSRSEKSPGGWQAKGGRRLKRLPRRWGPGGKRARDTPPTHAFLGRKEKGSPLLKPSNTPPKVGGCLTSSVAAVACSL